MGINKVGTQHCKISRTAFHTESNDLAVEIVPRPQSRNFRNKFCAFRAFPSFGDRQSKKNDDPYDCPGQNKDYEAENTDCPACRRKSLKNDTTSPTNDTESLRNATKSPKNDTKSPKNAANHPII